MLIGAIFITEGDHTMKKLIASTLIAFAINTIAVGAYAQQGGPQGCEPHPQTGPCTMWNDPQAKIYYDAYAYNLRNQQAQGVAIQDFDHERASWNGVAAMNGVALYGQQDAWAYKGQNNGR